MSLLRATLVLAQAVFNHLATTAPHPVPQSASRTPSPATEAPVSEKQLAKKPDGGILYGEEWRILRLAPLVFKVPVHLTSSRLV